MNALIERFCRAEDLATSDPYDIWKTPLGFRAKDLYNRKPRAGLLAVAKETLSEVRAKGTDILKAIREEKEISAATEGKLKSFLDQFAKTFT